MGDGSVRVTGVLMAAALIVASLAGAQNLVGNPGFDVGVEGWTQLIRIRFR